MDVFAAQRLLDLDRRFSRINVGLVQGAKVTQVESALETLTVGRALVGRPKSRGETLERLIAGQRFGMVSTGMIAVLVGVFLTFSTMMIAVTQRRLQIGVLRCVGMRQSEVFRLVAIEALTLGAAGSAVGVVLGFGLAKALLVAATVSLNRYLPVGSAEVSFLVGPVLWGLLLGPSCALVAALLPAREAMRIQPLEILHSTSVPSESDHSYWRTAAAGVLIMGVAATIWGMRDRLAFDASVTGGLVILGSLTGASLLAPAVLRNTAGHLERPLGSLLGAGGAIAGRNLISHTNRSTVTCAAFVMSLGGAIAVATVFAGISRTMTAWIDSAFSNFHLIVTSNGEPLSSDSDPFPATVIRDIASLPDVAAVDAERHVLIPYGGTLVRLTATDTRFYEQGVRQLALVQGGGEAIDALARGTAVVVNAVFAREFKTWRGATVTLATPAGEVRLPVAAVALDASPMGVIYVSRSFYGARWRDDSVSLASIMLRRGADAGQVTAEIRNRWGERHALFIITAGEFHRELQALLAQASASVYPLTIFALTIALFGLTNSLLASVQDRLRTIAVLRSVGATRRQVTRSLMVESGMIGLVGGTCAILVGSVVGYIGLHVFVHLFYMSILYQYPMQEVIFAFPVAVILAAAAGYVPGRRAANVNISGALSWE
jgi:putative ABC transport system permease protein